MFTAVLTLSPGHGFSADAGKSSVTGTAVASEEKTVPPAAEFKPDGGDVLVTGDFIEEGAKPAPIASVVPAAVTENKKSAKKPEEVKKSKEAAPVKIQTPQSVQTVPASALETQPVFAKASPEEIKKNWDSLFSKEITPGSVAYTVKSGDNLYMLAKKFHTTVGLIKKLNGRESDVLYPDMNLKIYTAPFSIWVSKGENTLVLYAEGKPVKRYPVATGKNNCTPAGTFKIVNKLVDPTWFKTGAILPPGSPENALGTRWMGFDKSGYGIHGTIDPKSIGSQASQGCIRMLNADVEELYSLVPSGTQVTVQD